MVRTFEEREEMINGEVTKMRDEIVALQKNYDSREKHYIGESKEFTDKIQILHELLEKAQERLEEGWDPQKTCLLYTSPSPRDQA